MANTDCTFKLGDRTFVLLPFAAAEMQKVVPAMVKTWPEGASMADFKSNVRKVFEIVIGDQASADEIASIVGKATFPEIFAALHAIIKNVTESMARLTPTVGCA